VTVEFATGINVGTGPTGENAMRVHQQPIPVHLREATFVLDGLLEHQTELDPRTVFTDTHGYTEVVMATAALLGRSLAPRIARMHEQTLHKLDPSRHYAQLDPILDGTVKPHLVRRPGTRPSAWWPRSTPEPRQRP
jgi:TnpA family transposase